MQSHIETSTAHLLLEDGRHYAGLAMGRRGLRFGEVVFSTSMTGYQELLTDPSYCGQILVSTVAHLGNTGINLEDDESRKCWLQGFIIQELCLEPSNWRALGALEPWLAERGVVGMHAVDTRALVRHLRHQGTMRGVICNDPALWNPEELMRQLKEWPTMEGSDFVREVSPTEVQQVGEGPPLVALDCGMKEEMVRLLAAQGFRIVRMPATTSAAEILALQPRGLFLSNGPGDPAVLQPLVSQVKQVLGKVPVFGICLGHQILAQALGGKTYKLKFGHRGCNQPVLHLPSGRVEITTQNHGFAVDASSLPPTVTMTHRNLNDQTCEGLEAPELRAFSVQYHPENAPGPHDSRYLFEQFLNWMEHSHAASR